MRALAAPTDIAGCVLWTDSLNDANLTYDVSNRVSQWSDLSGQGNHLLQAADANKMVRTPNASGNLTGLRVSSAAPQWAESATGAVMGNAPHTLFLVLQFVNNTGLLANSYPSFMMWGTGGSGGMSSGFSVNGFTATPALFLYGGGGYGAPVGVTPVQVGPTYVLCKRYNPFVGNNGRAQGRGDGFDLYKNFNIASTHIQVGGFSGASYPANFYVFAAIAYNRYLTDGEVIAVERYLANRYQAAGFPGRVSTFLPTDLSGLIEWNRADLGAGRTPGNKVVEWCDYSPAANHATQGSNAVRPNYNVNPINGRATFQCTAHYLDLASTPSTTASTMFAVLRPTASPLNGTILIPASSLVLYHTVGGSGGGAWGTYNNVAVVSGVLAVGTPCILQVTTRNFNDVDLGTNGTIVNRTTGTAFNARTARIGADGAGANPAAMDLAELIFYNRVLSVMEARAVGRYLGQQYAMVMP